jgi:predicted nuclease of predicted toxin-antitoxin system
MAHFAPSIHVSTGGVLHVDIRGVRERNKSFTDQRLMLHGQEIAERDPECAFVVVSNDKDFIPLIVTLRKRGHAVFVACFEVSLADEISRVATSVIKLCSKEVGGGFVSSLTSDRVPDVANLLARCSGASFACLAIAVREAQVLISQIAKGEGSTEKFPDATLAALLRESPVAREAVEKLADASSLKKGFISGLSGLRGWGKLQLQVALRLLLLTPHGKHGAMARKRRAAAEIGLLLDVRIFSSRAEFVGISGNSKSYRRDRLLSAL